MQSLHTIYWQRDIEPQETSHDNVTRTNIALSHLGVSQTPSLPLCRAPAALTQHRRRDASTRRTDSRRISVSFQLMRTKQYGRCSKTKISLN